MPKGYKHLTWTNRIEINALHLSGHSKLDIAIYIGCDRSTISRELRRATYVHRNPDWTEEVRYSPELAQERYEKNKKAKGPELKIGNNLKLLLFIEECISKDKKSPYAALQAAKTSGLFRNEDIPCLATIYNYIKKGIFPNITLKDCPMPRKTGKKKKVCVEKKRVRGTSIDYRPDYINNREEPGHWEMDTVEGGKGSRVTLLVLTERTSNLEIIEKLKAQTQKEVVLALNRMERRMGEKAFRETFKTITVDNGSEFSDWQGMERSRRNRKKRTKIYVCHPYHAWERGQNECNNKFIRRWIPKGENFDDISRNKVKQIQEYMNRYPRPKLLGLSANDINKLIV